MKTVLRPGQAVTMDAEHGVVTGAEIVVEGDRIAYVGPARRSTGSDGTRASYGTDTGTDDAGTGHSPGTSTGHAGTGTGTGHSAHTGTGTNTSADDGQGTRVVELPHHVALPGIVNAHTHVAGNLFRGITEDPANGFYGLALPTERFLDRDDIYALSRLGVLECLRGGSTTILDMYHYADETARAAAELGIRAQVAYKVYDTDVMRLHEGHLPVPEQAEWRLAENVRLYDTWHGAADGRVSVRFGAHAVDTVSPELLAAVGEHARSRGVGTTIHVAQSAVERDYVRERYGVGSVARLAREGFLGEQSVLAHAVFVDDGEVDLLADSGAGVAHCPVITAKRGKFAPVDRFYQRGVRVSWGTDWVSMDPWQVMRFGILVPRVLHDDVAMLSAYDAVRRMTLGGAEVLGIADQVGSLTVGKKADLLLVDTDQPHLTPMLDPVPTLVYNATGRDVSHVMVDGRFVVADGAFTGDTADVHQAARDVATRVWDQAGLRPAGVS